MRTVIQEARPFLKWAGGKSQLLDQIQPFLPKKLSSPGKIKKYFEPFLGGGALFFYLSSKYDFEEIYLYEVNKVIAHAYRVIKLHVPTLIDELKELEKTYLNKTDARREKYFYKIRGQFNDLLSSKSKNHSIKKTALLIFLNRTCFNGLYRVNSKGAFNVPFGKYKNPKICDEDNLYAVSRALKNAQIVAGDFSLCLEHAGSDSFLYFDPPYRPLSATANFTSYAKNSFDDTEQIRLKGVIDNLNEKGGLVMLSNSDPKNTNVKDDFFDDLYCNYKIERVKASRMINCNADKRGEVTEIIVTNY